MSQVKPSLDELRIERKADGSSQRSSVWLLLIVALLLVMGGGAWWWLRTPGAVEVRTAVARESVSGAEGRTVLNASGYVTARRAATVSSKVTGKVMEVLFEEGMRVEEGQILARLDATNIQASLRLAESQLESARAMLAETRVRLRENEQELQRQTRLLESGIASQADFDHAEAALLAAKARLVQQEADVVVAERHLVSWQQQLDDTVIRAPFSGIVTSKNAQPGEMISPVSAGGGFTRTGICTIVDMQSLEIEIDVNESYINRVEPGQAVEGVLDAYPDWKIPCKVTAIIPTADRQKSTVRVRVGFEKLDRRILPEMSVKVAFREANTSGAAPARQILVPKTALRQQGGRDVVLVVQGGRAERRAVTVSGSGPDETAISSGLAAGELIVVQGPAGLADGALVKEAKP